MRRATSAKWVAGLALVMWLAPSAISTGQGVAASPPRHVDTRVLGGEAALLARADVQVTAAVIATAR